MTDPARMPSESDPVSQARKRSPATVLRERWNEHAAEWIAWVRDPEFHDSYWRFHRDRFLELVPDPGKLTLDIGCGEGRVGRDLQVSGHTVLGVDCSLTMCRAAATHPDDPTPAIAGDAARMPLPDESADCAIAFMSLQDIDDMPGAVAEIARVLQDGHKLALAIVHPMYSAAARNPDGNFVIKRPYFTSELCISTDKQDDLTVTFYREHRPLQVYMNALIKAGFSIDEWQEVTDDEDQASHRVPMFLDILATRLPRENATDSAHQPRTAHVVPGRPRRRRHVGRKRAGKPGSRRSGHSLQRRAAFSRKVSRGREAAYLSLGDGLIFVGTIALLVISFFAVPPVRRGGREIRVSR